MRGAVTPNVLRAVYFLVVLLPTTTGLVQLLAWSQFDLTGERLRRVAASDFGSTATSSRGDASESLNHVGDDAGASALELQPASERATRSVGTRVEGFRTYIHIQSTFT